MNDIIAYLVLYYVLGFLFSIWNMKRLDRSLGKLADEIGLNHVPWGKQVLCVAMMLAIFAWPIGLVDLLRRG